jgi:MFS family permease
MSVLLPASAKPGSGLLLFTRGVRGFADGAVSVLLPIYLLALGYDAIAVGILSTVALAGSAALTLFVGLGRVRLAPPALLATLAGLMAVTGAGYATLVDWWPLLAIALLGTINPSAGDVTAFLPVEQAQLAERVSEQDRTALYARYSLVGSLTGAIGALIAGVPGLLEGAFGIGALDGVRLCFAVYGAIGLALIPIYRRLDAHAPRAKGPAPKPQHAAPLGPSRGVVYRLTALFCMDSFGGGLVVNTILVIWLLARFDFSPETAGVILFWTGLLSAASQLLAAPLARRIGLVNTMVFTHLPANLFLMLAPFAPTPWIAVALLSARSLLSSMDVPARTALVMQLVTPAERQAAAAITSAPRSLTAAAGPMISGLLLAASPFGWPLVAAGAVKAAYDLLLLAMFRGGDTPVAKPTPPKIAPRKR